MDTIKNYFDSFLKFTNRNSPQILTGLGVLGVIETGFLAYKAGEKGRVIMDKKRKDLRDVQPGDREAKRAVMGEIVKEMTPVLAPPVLMGIATGACIIGSNKVSTRRIAAISAAYSLTETALKEYKQKTVELIGERKAQNIREAIAKDKIQKNPPSEASSPIIITGNGDVKCFDSYSGRYFYSNAQKIGNAICKLSNEARNAMYVSLNEFWDEIGLPRTNMGEDLGWNCDDCIDGQLPIATTAILTPEGEPCLCIDYELGLRMDYRNLH